MNRQTAIRVLKGLALWIPTVMLALLFIMQGIMKLVPDSPWSQRFTGWGYPGGSHVVVGAIELLAAIALLFPRSAAYAASTLALVMLGAAATHLFYAEWINVGFTLTLAVVFAVIARVRMSRRSRVGGVAPQEV
jgi:putative oxidoreductase